MFPYGKDTTTATDLASSIDNDVDTIHENGCPDELTPISSEKRHPLDDDSQNDAGSVESSSDEGVDAGPELTIGDFSLYTAAQIKRRPSPEALIDGTLFKNTLAVMDGHPRTFKSFLALDWSLSIAAGTAWLGHHVAQGGVLYISAEGSAGLGIRIEAWELARGTIAPGTFLTLPDTVKLLEPSTARNICALVAALPAPPVLIVVDTLARSFVGGDENNSEHMGRLIEAADYIRKETGATVLFIAHVNKGQGTLRGHSSLLGAVDTEIKLERANPTKNQPVVRTVTLSCPKQKDAAEFLPFTLEACEVALSGGRTSLVLEITTNCVAPEGDDPDNGLTKQDLQAYKHLASICTAPPGVPNKEWLSRCDVAEGAARVPRSSFQRARDKLIRAGRVAAIGPERGQTYWAVLNAELTHQVAS